MSRIYVSVLALLAVFTGSAWATPERITSSEDRIVAATQTHLYVLRDVIDNQGSHYKALHDQHLVGIALDTGEATQFWPLRRMAISHLETDDFLVPGQVTERAGPTHDLNAVLRQLGAEPLAPQIWGVDELALAGGALMRGEEELATPFAIRAAGRAQLGILRKEYPPIETEEEYIRAEQIVFYDLYASGDWECVLRSEGQTLFRAKDRVLVAKLQCEDADFSGIWSFHIIVRDEL